MRLNDVGQASEEDEVPQAPRLSGMAVASLIFGLLGCLVVPAVPALILGIIAYRAIGREPERYHGKGIAVSGIILSIFSIFIVFPIMAILVPAFGKAHERAQRSSCLSNLRQISIGLQLYALDYDGHFPPAASWNQAVLSMHTPKQVLICPAAGGREVSYAINRRLAGKTSANLVSPGETALVFDSIPGANMAGGADVIPNPSRHGEDNIMGFADGHVKPVSREEMRDWYTPVYAKTPVRNHKAAHSSK